MDDFPSGKGECRETRGFLFSHRCGRFATTACGQCGKDICDRHSVAEGDAVWCTTCAKQSRPGTSRPGTSRPGTSHPGGYYHDPYYYAYDHYPHYHADRDDFTDGDEAALAGGAAAAAEMAQFEDQMGDS